MRDCGISGGSCNRDEIGAVIGGWVAEREDRIVGMVVNGRRPREVLACPSGRGEWTFRRN